MATPMSADAWLNCLRIEGITKIVQMPKWKTHNRDAATGKPFGPVHGVVIHHTAGVGPGMAGLCYHGTASLPGPLCHDFLAKDGTLYLVGHGRTNHAGTVTPAVKAAIIAEDKPASQREQGAETVDGNDFLYGLEIENRGDGKDPYPAAQYDVAVRWAAARARYHGWSAQSVWGHKEITTRKIDPSFPMSTFRTAVAARLASHPSAPATPTTPTVPTTPPRTLESTGLGMTDYTAVSLTGTSQSLTDGQTREIYFTGEQSDDPGDHGLNGKTVLTGPAQFNGAGKLRFSAPVPDGVTARLVRQEANATVGTEWMTDVTEGADHFVFPVIGTVGAGQDLVLTVVNNSGQAITLVEAFLRFNSQAA